VAGMKKGLRDGLRPLRDELDQYLGQQYGEIGKESLAAWKKSAQPFHWFIEFYTVMKTGGFDVIIGNPPYVEYSKIKPLYTLNSYKTETCGNLHAFVLERCYTLAQKGVSVGLIVPMSAISSDRMAPLQTHVVKCFQNVWLSHFSERPAQLFIGARPMLTIIIAGSKSRLESLHSTTLHRWYSYTRETLFETMRYCGVPAEAMKSYSLPKFGVSCDVTITAKILKSKNTVNSIMRKVSPFVVLYNRSFLYWFKSFTFAPKFFAEGSGKKESDDHQKSLYTDSEEDRAVLCALLNSSLIYWYTIKYSNGREVTKEAISEFPLDLSEMQSSTRTRLVELCHALMHDLQKDSKIKNTFYKGVGTVTYQEFFFGPSKPIIDKIDAELARHFHFSADELDFLINYDVKYRLGRGNETEGD